MSIIDALTAGFNIVMRRLWLILIPVGLDFCLWLGPRISIEPLIKRLEPLLMFPSSGTDRQAWFISREALSQLGQSFNMLSLLVNSLLGVPSLMTTSPVEASLSQPPVMEVSSGWLVVALFFVLLLISVLIASLYLGLIAQQVRDGRINLGWLIRRVWVFWGRIVGLGLLLVGMLLIFTLPLSVMSALVALFSRGLALIVASVFSLVALWFAITIMIYLFFVISAIVMNDVGILQAVRHSIVIVRQNLWATIGLIILTNVIGTGLSLVWQRLATVSWGTVISILGNAYIGSGLVAAVLTFYLDRYQKWQQEMQNDASPSLAGT